MNLARSRISTSVLILILCLAGVANVGCLGKASRQKAAVPALVLSSDGIQSDSVIYIQSLTDPVEQQRAINIQSTFFAAIRTQDRVLIAVEAVHLWPQVRQMALMGIQVKHQRGLIGPAGVNAFNERVDRFEEVLFLSAENSQ